MSKRRKRKNSSKQISNGLFALFGLPALSWSNIQLLKKWLNRKMICRFLWLFAGSILLFRFVPIPFSGYMAQQQIGHWLKGDFSYRTHYQWKSLDQISWQMQLAVIAAEDQRFPEHSGFDWDSIEHAIKHNLRGKAIRGGSTISQQTAKNLYLWHGQSWLRKGLEVPVTMGLELLWSKQRILETYLNIAEFGNGIFGVEAAAQYYFKKSAKNLSQNEAALLAAVLPNPLIYKVKNPSIYVRKRQAWISKQMSQLGKNYLQKL